MSVLSFLRDPIWQFAGFLTGVIGIVITFGLAIRQRTQKGLICIVDVNADSLLGLNSEEMERLSARFGKHKSFGLGKLTVRLINTGDRAIRETDFVQDIRLSFSDISEVLEVDTTSSTIPLADKVQIPADRRAVCVGPILINAGEEITLSVLARFPQGFRVSSRFVDVKPVRVVTRLSNSWDKWKLIAAVCGAAVFVSTSVEVFGRHTAPLWAFYGISIMLFLNALLEAFSVWSNYRFYSKPLVGK